MSLQEGSLVHFVGVGLVVSGMAWLGTGVAHRLSTGVETLAVVEGCTEQSSFDAQSGQTTEWTVVSYRYIVGEDAYRGSGTGSAARCTSHGPGGSVTVYFDRTNPRASRTTSDLRAEGVALLALLVTALLLLNGIGGSDTLAARRAHGDAKVRAWTPVERAWARPLAVSWVALVAFDLLGTTGAAPGRTLPALVVAGVAAALSVLLPRHIRRRSAAGAMRAWVYLSATGLPSYREPALRPAAPAECGAHPVGDPAAELWATAVGSIAASVVAAAGLALGLAGAAPAAVTALYLASWVLGCLHCPRRPGG